MTAISVTPATAPLAAATNKSANFVRENFDAIIWQKGYEVIKESALKCPCRSRRTNQLSDCKNCGGTGWIFINAKKTRMIIHSMNLSTKFKEWSQENLGTASISCLAEDELSYMDRITVNDGNAVFSEVLFLQQSNTLNYFTTIYNIKEIHYIALFIGATQLLQPLIYGTDFTYSENVIDFLTAATYINPLATEQDISITIRYQHAPQFHVLDIPRETMQTFNQVNGSEEGAINLPIHAVGRRSHYVLDRDTIDSSRMLRNDRPYNHDDFNPPIVTC